MILRKVTKKRDRLKSLFGSPKPSQETVAHVDARSSESRPNSPLCPPSPHILSNVHSDGESKDRSDRTTQVNDTPEPIHQHQPGPPPLWEVALSRLESTTSGADSSHAQKLRACIPHDPLAPTHEKDLLESVRIAAEEKRQSLSDSAWSMRVGHRTIRSGQISQKILTWLNKFKDIGDQVVTYDPYHAALPWAAFRFLLSVATITSEQDAELLEGVDISLRACLRCRIFESQYPQIRSKITPASQELVDALKEDIIWLYVAIFSFLGLALKCLESGAFSNAASGLLDPERISSKLIEITRRDNALENTFRTCERLLQNELHHDIIDRFDTSQKLLDIQLDRVNNQLGQVWESFGTEQMALISRWVSNVAYEDDYHRFQKSRSADTCEWLLTHDTYQEWADSQRSAILWLHGIPGAGKSHLSSKVIESALQKDEAIAYFFCDRSRDDHRDPAKVLQCLVKQLAVKLDLGIDQETVAMYESKRSTGFASDQLSITECELLLPKLISRRGGVKIVIDGLDECDKATRVADVLDAIDTVMKNSSAIVKVFIASRDERDIRESLGDSQNLKIKAQNQRDIVRFVQSKMEGNRWWSEKMSPHVRDLVLKQFSIKSQGMFLWAKLHIDDLLKYESDKLVVRWLDNLPEGLEKTYDGIYDSIDKKMQRYVDQAFLWLMLYGAYPDYQTPEIISKLALQDHDDDFDPDVSMSSESFLSLCCNLIIEDDVGPAGHVYRFPHLSVREYLEQRRGLTVSEANKLALNVSINYWLWVAAPDTPQDSIWRIAPRIDYNGPIQIIQFYVKSGICKADPSFRKLSGFLGDPIHGSKAYWHSAERNPFRSGFGSSVKEGMVSPIEAAAAAGCSSLILSWLEDGLVSNPITRLNQSLITTACAGLRPRLPWYRSEDDSRELQERLDMIKLLLENGTMPSPEGHEVMMLLELTTGNRPATDGIVDQLAELLPLLFTNGVKCSPDVTPFQILVKEWAAVPGQATIRRLIAQGADPTVGDREGNIALHHSCLWEDVETVEALLTRGGHDVNQRNHLGYTPLHICCQNAATHRNMQVLKLLLASTTDPAFPDNSGNTALHIACMVGNIDTAKALLGAGGNVSINRRNMDGHTPLHICCHRALETKNLDMMRLMLEYGADPNEGDLDGDTALHTICQTFTMANLRRRMPQSANGEEGNRVPVVDYAHVADALDFFQSSAQIKMLLDHGVDIDRISDRGATALHIVCAEGHVNTARSLVDAGASVECSGPWRGTALDVLEYRRMAGRCDGMYDGFLELLALTREVT